ncbi:MAG: hypothetical protein IIA64_10150 [Planctomycetes bacterium]|nr:hypothetical protein [Planctomycetota bacterium]
MKSFGGRKHPKLKNAIFAGNAILAISVNPAVRALCNSAYDREPSIIDDAAGHVNASRKGKVNLFQILAFRNPSIRGRNAVFPKGGNAIAWGGPSAAGGTTPLGFAVSGSWQAGFRAAE